MCHKSNFDPAPSRNGRHGTEESDRRRRARLRGLCNMFSSFVRSGSGGSTKDDFCAIFPPPQRKHEKEFRDRTFDAQIFMLCKIAHFIKSPESSVAAFSNQGEKSCIFACVRTVTNFRYRTTERRFVKALIRRVPQKIRASRQELTLWRCQGLMEILIEPIKGL